MSQEKPKKDEAKSIHGPYYSDLTVDDVKKRKSKSKGKPKDKSLSSNDDGCGNGY